MRKIIAALSLLLSLNIAAQEYRSPLDIPIYLSANFAELRPNHFHSGIDLKTAGVINKPVFAIADGFVSRISVSPSGYGLAIYVDHPSGQTSVCGHIERFAPQIAEYVKAKQYEQQSFIVDLELDNSVFPVKKGELIAYSGNTGSSMGPHVHFEIRETATQKALDPLTYFRSQIKDTLAPTIKGISVYPLAEEGVVNDSSSPFRETLAVSKSGQPASLRKDIKAWGKIGIGISATDRMDGTANVYGVKKVRLLCDDKEVFASNIESFLFGQSRMINSLIDFDYWYRHKTFYMKSFVEPANKLPIYTTVNDGYITIDEERIYNLQYELEDLYGNKTAYQFSITGQKQDIPVQRPCSLSMVWYHDNHYISKAFCLDIPKESLYDNIGFVLKKQESAKHFSDIYTVHDSYIPLDSYCRMKLEMKIDTLANKKQYGIVNIGTKGESWVGGTYEDGYMTVSIRELGHQYAVSCDNKGPLIAAVAPDRWVKQQKITIKLSDNKSGIASWKGMIDGEFALFEHDTKSPNYIYKFDPKRLKKNQKHKLVFTATDRAGNEAMYEYQFTY